MTTKPIQPAERERLRRLHEEATPGPWEQWAGRGLPQGWADMLGLEGDHAIGWPLCAKGGDGSEALVAAREYQDQSLIAELRNAYPAIEEALRVAAQTIEDIFLQTTEEFAKAEARQALIALGLLPGEEGSRE